MTQRSGKQSDNRLSLIGDPALGDRQLAAARELLIAAGVPPEFLDDLVGAADFGAALLGLEATGRLASPRDAFAALLDGFRPLLARGTDPLTAELSGAEFLATARFVAPEGAEPSDMLADLIPLAENSGTSEALAMLRVFAVVGYPPTRPAAAAAADRLVAAGLVDRPWVRGLGSPAVGQAFIYSDPFGCQDYLLLTFRYGRRSHLLAALVDYHLGGGIKDCWFGDDPAAARSAIESSAPVHGMVLREIPAHEAADILERALACEPCPVDPDQIEDVATHLDLLRQRVALLRAAPPSKPRATGTVHRLKITLAGSKPPIWRRLEVPSATSLDQLHLDIQAAFGWAGYHMWAFVTEYDTYGVPDAELGFDDAATMTLRRVAPQPGDRLRYEYDFGDGWEHRIAVEAVAVRESGVNYPRCLTGRRACPPEDCGGMWGYADLLEILADAEHPEHGERLEWLGLDSADQLDPAAFDVGEVNAALSRRARH